MGRATKIDDDRWFIVNGANRQTDWVGLSSAPVAPIHYIRTTQHPFHKSTH